MTESGAVSQATIRTACPPRLNDDADYSGSNELMCGIDRLSVVGSLLIDTTTTCPAGAQAEVDSLYSTCDGGTDWESEKAAWKNFVESKGCGGAAQAMPAIALVVAAVSGPKIPAYSPATGTDDSGAQVVNMLN